MSEFRDYLNQITELPEDVLLGRVVMFTVSDMNDVTPTQMAAWFSELGLSANYLPAPNRAVDAFKKATTDVDGTEFDRPTSRTIGTLMTRDVSTDNEMIVRHLVREIKNSKRKTLSHETVAELVFYKAQSHQGKVVPGTERIRLTVRSDAVQAEDSVAVNNALQQIKQAYDDHLKFVDAQKLRALIRKYLKYLNAIEIKGGVYFIHKNRTTELLQLRELVNRCGQNTRMDQIPIVDLENEREIIREAFQREAEQALNDLTTEITMVRSTRKKITPSMYAKLRGKYDDVMSQAMEYQRTLNITQTRTSAAAELALDSLTELQKDFLR